MPLFQPNEPLLKYSVARTRSGFSTNRFARNAPSNFPLGLELVGLEPVGSEIGSPCSTYPYAVAGNVGVIEKVTMRLGSASTSRNPRSTFCANTDCGSMM